MLGKCWKTAVDRKKSIFASASSRAPLRVQHIDEDPAEAAISAGFELARAFLEIGPGDVDRGEMETLSRDDVIGDFAQDAEIVLQVHLG